MGCMLRVRVHGSGQGQAVWYRKGGVMCNKRRGVRVSGRGSVLLCVEFGRKSVMYD